MHRHNAPRWARRFGSFHTATLVAASGALALTPAVAAQTAGSGTYTLRDGAGWVADGEAEAPSADEAEIRRIRTLLADDRASEALSALNAFIESAESDGSAYLPEALLLRGDAKVARDEEFDALYDYERLLRSFPSSEHFVTANERELRIAEMYLSGLRLRFFGMRIIDASDIAIELLIRVQERVPGSELAEEAAIMLADYYYKKREMRLAREAYELYLLNFPEGPNRLRAERRLIYADMARFKGPRYDGSALQDVRLRIREFESRFPNEAAASGINEGLVARIDESTAAQLLESAEWYINQGDDAAARYTIRRMLRAHPETIAAQAAMKIMDDRGWLYELPSDSEPALQDSVTVEGNLADQVEVLDGEGTPTPEQGKEPSGGTP